MRLFEPRFRPRVHRPGYLVGVLAALAILAGPALAASAETTAATAATPAKSAAASKDVPDLSWVPPEDEFDWVQLKSGEWLKGHIRALQDDEMDFDSEELDDLVLDWEDIRQVRTGRRFDVLLDDGQEVSGRVVITPKEIRVDGATVVAFERSRLLSLTRGGSREVDYWSGKASIGLTLRSGNLDQVDYDAMLHMQRRTPGTRLSLDYIGNVSSIDEVESANNHRVNAEFDVWISSKLYLIVPAGEYFSDPYQNIRTRVTAGGGLGYAFYDLPDFKWTVSAGPAYQWVQYESVLEGEPSESESVALVLASSFDWDITKRLEWKVDYRGQVTSEEVGETNHHLTSTFSIDVTERVDLDLSFVWDRIGRPKTGEDGTVPEKDDYRFIVGLGMDF